MSESVKAKNAYDTIVRLLDEKGWRYREHEDRMIIESGVSGDDLPIALLFVVTEKNQVVRLFSKLPFDVPEDKRFEAAVAVAAANYGLVDGSFDYDMRDGEIRYRVTVSYREQMFGADMLDYMIGITAGTVDNYNDKFFKLAKGLISIQDFLEEENG